MNSPSTSRKPLLLALAASFLLTVLIIAGSREQKRLECPCHEGAFDAATGNVLYGPPPRPLDVIELEVRNGELWAIGRKAIA